MQLEEALAAQRLQNAGSPASSIFSPYSALRGERMGGGKTTTKQPFNWMDATQLGFGAISAGASVYGASQFAGGFGGGGGSGFPETLTA